MKHKHHDILISIAETPESINDFEICYNGLLDGCHWRPFAGFAGWIEYPEKYEIRRKHKTMLVHGIEVPEPYREMPPDGTDYWIPDFYTNDYATACATYNDAFDCKILSLGLMHKTKEAAILHAKVMLGEVK